MSAEVAATVMFAFEQMSIDESRSADTGAEGEHEHVFVSLCGTVQPLAKKCGFGIVEEFEGEVELGFSPGFKIKVYRVDVFVPRVKDAHPVAVDEARG